MAFKRSYDKQTVEKFHESVKGDSLYFGAKDIEDSGTLVRVVPWVYDGRPIDILLMEEGWMVTETEENGKKVKGQKPIRFDFGVEIPSDIEWAIGKSFDGKPGKPQSPKSAVAFLLFILNKRQIKIASFTQAGLVKPLIDMMDENNANFIDDFTKVDLILSAKEEKGKKGATYNIVPKVNSKPQPPDGYIEALSQFSFSFEEFMSSRDPFDETKAIKAIDLADMFNENFGIVIGSGSKPKASPSQQPAATSNKNIGDWKTFKTPAGKILGECDLDTLKSFKKKLEEGGKTGTDLYSNIVAGVDELSKSNSAEEDI